MEWTRGLLLELLDLYQKEPALWNPGLPEHKNQAELNEAWARIQRQLHDGSVPIKAIRHKRDNLMSVYRRLRKKVNKYKNTERHFKPKWTYYNIMSSFLDDHYTTRLNDSGENTSGDERPLQKVHLKRRKIEKPVKAMNVTDSEATQNPNRDECSLYTELLCRKLRGLEEHTRDLAMLEIDKMLFHLKQNESKQHQHRTQLLGSLRASPPTMEVKIRKLSPTSDASASPHSSNYDPLHSP